MTDKVDNVDGNLQVGDWSIQFNYDPGTDTWPLTVESQKAAISFRFHLTNKQAQELFNQINKGIER